MDKIKTVKIKNPNGSVSEETYTIAVDARNVDMENGKELQETIGTINIDNDGDISNQLKNLKSNKINKIDIIDNLESNDKNKVLSANQGKEINDKLKKKPYYFDNVADMKAATYLKNGDMAVTLGYYEINDGGGAEYYITDTLDETKYQEKVNGLYAELIIENGNYNILKLGAHGNGIDDDSEAFNKLLNLTNIINLPSRKYLISEPINLYSELKINGNNSEIITTNNTLFTLNNDTIWNCELSNLKLTGNGYENSIAFTGNQKFRNGRLTNLRISNFYKIFDNTYFLATMINKCNFISKDIIGKLNFNDATINQCYFDCNESLYDINKYCLIINGNLLNLSNSFFNGNVNNEVPTFLYIQNSNGISINNCNFDYNDGYAIYCNNNKGLTINKCTFRGNARQQNCYIKDITGEIKIVNCSFLLPHDETYPYNKDAKIFISNGYSKNAILENNYYEINFDYESEYDSNSDNIQIFENEVYNKNILPLPEIDKTSVPSSLYLNKTFNSIYINGILNEVGNVFINGNKDNVTTLFTIKSGNYKVFTNSKNVELIIKTSEGSTRYKNNENITFDNDINVIGIAIRLEIASYNKEFKIMLCKQT